VVVHKYYVVPEVTGVFLADEEAVDDRQRARRASHDKPDIVSRRVVLNRCGPYLENRLSARNVIFVGRDGERMRLRSRRGGAQNLAQERLRSARRHWKSRLLAEATLERRVDFFFYK
jgi:hypothetical protein